MTKADDYRTKLCALDNWDSYLLKESGLPGPRGNIELAQVVADEGNRQLFQRYIVYTADKAPVNSPYEFLAFCGIVGLGRLIAEGDSDLLKTLRRYAPRNSSSFPADSNKASAIVSLIPETGSVSHPRSTNGAPADVRPKRG